MSEFYRAAQEVDRCDRCPNPIEVGDPIIEEVERGYDGDELAGRYHEECDPARLYGAATGAYLGDDPATARADAHAAAAVARWDADRGASMFYRPTPGREVGTWNVFPRHGAVRLDVPWAELPDEVRGYLGAKTPAAGDHVPAA